MKYNCCHCHERTERIVRDGIIDLPICHKCLPTRRIHASHVHDFAPDPSDTKKEEIPRNAVMVVLDQRAYVIPIESPNALGLEPHYEITLFTYAKETWHRTLKTLPIGGFIKRVLQCIDEYEPEKTGLGLFRVDPPAPERVGAAMQAVRYTYPTIRLRLHDGRS